MEKIFGIDLGTTNSEIACVEDGKARVITLPDGNMYLPSVVGVDPSGQIVTGVPARNQYAAFPENTVMSVKRKMGSGEMVSMAGTEYRPAEIACHILKSLKTGAEQETGAPVEKAVITVPAYFSDRQRKETIEAGEIAGLEVVRIINEPTAAALAYGCREDHQEKILVYDFGGGTFDISLIEVEEGVVEVVATDGDSSLGGDDIDRLLVNLLASRLPPKTPVTDLRLRARLRSTAEAVKIALSTKTLAEVKEEFLATVGGKPVNLETTVTRTELEDLMEEVLDRTFSLVDDVLREGKLKPKDITKLLLVGGSSFIPRIFHTLSEDLALNVHREVDPTYCVAIGAAIQGAIITGEEVDTVLVDVNSHSLGIRCLGVKRTGDVDDDHYSTIIPRNTPIPTSMSETFYTVMANQKAVEISAYQGEEPMASRNTFIGSFVLDGLPKELPAGSEIDVTFQYNLNGVVEISAAERRKGKKETLQVDVHRLRTIPEEGKEAGKEA